MRPRHSFRATLLLLLLLMVIAAYAQQDKALSATDLLSWKNIESVELSPDGKQVIFTTRERDWKANKYAKSIWVMDTSATATPVPLTGDDKDDNPRWAPDGSRIAFVSTREGGAQIWTIAKPGGTAEKLTSVAGGVTSFQ